MVSLGERGIETRQVVDSPRKAFCVFEHIYFARPDSILEGNRTQVSRRKMGEILLREAPVEADVVIAVPDSGNAAAAGYSKASGIPRDDGLIKNRYVARTFIQPGQELRKHGLRMKFNPLREVVEGKRLVVVDDSIVRGNTTRQIVGMLRDAGALEVHMRISAPPIRHPCHYGVDMSTTQEMVAHGRTVEEIAERARLRLARLPLARGRLRGDPRRARHPLRRLLLRRVPARAHRGRQRQVRPRAAGRRLAARRRACRAQCRRRPASRRRSARPAGRPPRAARPAADLGDRAHEQRRRSTVERSAPALADAAACDRAPTCIRAGVAKPADAPARCTHRGGMPLGAAEPRPAAVAEPRRRASPRLSSAAPVPRARDLVGAARARRAPDGATTAGRRRDAPRRRRALTAPRATAARRLRGTIAQDA